jgi:hypothetical protein
VLRNSVRQFVLEPSLSECWGNGRGLGSSVCVRSPGARALSEGSGDDEERRCELREVACGSFDFELVRSYFVSSYFVLQVSDYVAPTAQ